MNTSTNQADFLYYGLFLDDVTKAQLTEWFVSKCKKFARADLTYYVDHCTLLFKTQMDSQKAKALKPFLDKNLGIVLPLTITAIGYSSKAIAFRVGNMASLCMNPIPHITIATLNGGKPKDSNDIQMWIDLNEKFDIEATLKKIAL